MDNLPPPIPSDSPPTKDSHSSAANSEDGFLAGSAKRPLKRSEIFVGLAVAALTLLYLANSNDSSPPTKKPSANKAASKVNSPKPICPIFQHEAALQIKELKAQLKKLESLVNLVNSNRPLPSTIDGYARQVTTRDIRGDSQAILTALTARMEELDQVKKASNGYAFVVSDVRRGFSFLLLAVSALEQFVNEFENRVQAARALKDHLAAVKKAVSDAEERFHQTSSLAGFELTKRSEYQEWFDKARTSADRLSGVWKEVNQNQASVNEVERRLTSLGDEAKRLSASFDKWILAVRAKEAAVSDPNEMDRLIQYDDLDMALIAVFGAITDTAELQMSDDQKSRADVLNFMVQRIEDAQQEFAKQSY